MCIQVKTIFRCNCPYQNIEICPHHVYIRNSPDEIEHEGTFSQDGFQLRLASALQAHRDWTPLPHAGDSPYPRWDHCAVYKSRYRDLDSDASTAAKGRDQRGKGKGKENVIEGKEHVCPNWVKTEETVSRLVRGLCSLCEDRHGMPVVEKDWSQGEVENHLTRQAAQSRASGRGMINTQSPVRKILSQMKQKVIRENLMGSGPTSRSSSAPGDRRKSGEGKESQGDVFSRLQVDAARKRGTSVSSVGSGSRTGTPDKGRPSSRQMTKKPAWGGGSGGKK